MNRQEASLQDLKGFAQETKLPFPLVYLVFKIISRHHAVPVPEFAHSLRQAAGARGTLRPVHHIFWRAELDRVTGSVKSSIPDLQPYQFFSDELSQSFRILD
jgi:hypothetical protein